MSEISGDIHIGHLMVESPYANAGGLGKRLEEIHALGLTGGGWIESGSWTREPRAGNNPDGTLVDYYHDPKTGKTHNALGMPGKGIDYAVRQVPEMLAETRGKPLVMNVAPVTDDPVAESVELVSRMFEAGASAVLLNAGCPNVPSKDGGRHEILSASPDALRLVLNALRDITEKHYPIFLRTTPLEGLSRISEIAQVIAESGVVSAVFTPNTWPIPPEDNVHLGTGPNIGGQSGPAMLAPAIIQAGRMRYFLNHSRNGRQIDTVLSGGITTGKALYEGLTATGAVAGAGTTFYYEPVGGWANDVTKLLWDYAEASE